MSATVSQFGSNAGGPRGRELDITVAQAAVVVRALIKGATHPHTREQLESFAASHLDESVPRAFTETRIEDILVTAKAAFVAIEGSARGFKISQFDDSSPVSTPALDRFIETVGNDTSTLEYLQRGVCDLEPFERLVPLVATAKLIDLDRLAWHVNHLRITIPDRGVEDGISRFIDRN